MSLPSYRAIRSKQKVLIGIGYLVNLSFQFFIFSTPFLAQNLIKNRYNGGPRQFLIPSCKGIQHSGLRAYLGDVLD